MRDTVSVHDIIGMEYVGVSESDTVKSAAELMLAEDASTVVVLRGTQPVGMVTCRDALSALVDDGASGDQPVSAVMSEPAPRITTLAAVDEASDVMFSEPTSHLLVFDEGEFVGVLSERDVMAATSSRAVDASYDAGDSFDSEADESTLRADGSTDERGTDGFSTQSICEVCGALVRDLSNMNGQLICVDCREV